jgi:hypothetical protein
VTPEEALAFVERVGVALEAARGPVPSLAETIVGKPLRGSYWGHPKGNNIFLCTRAVRNSADVLICRLVGGKVTYVHRRLWPALVRLAARINAERLAAIHETHSASGKHQMETIPFPKWVPPDVQVQARLLEEREALVLLPFLDGGSVTTP